MPKKNISAFIYARLDSKRFPSKALSMIKNMTLLEILFRRSKYCEFTDCYLLTSDRNIDDALCDHANSLGLKYIRGDANDLTKRTQKAISVTGCDYFIRLNGDSPFIEPELINFAIGNIENIKFVSNIFQRTFPYGIAIELIDSEFYLSSLKTNINKNDLEHVTKHLYKLDGKFLSITQDINQSDLEIVIDEPFHLDNLKNIIGDLDLIKTHYWDILRKEKPNFIKNIIC
jgi:spore coat polysaccharide biosynthesis protein SpsF